MLRRIGLAEAIINDPGLVILDEPTSGLDSIASRENKRPYIGLAKVRERPLSSARIYCVQMCKIFVT